MMRLRYGMLLGALASTALVYGEGSLPDDASNHWAYAALDRAATEGLLQNPSRWLYATPRPASRYEMAVEFRQAYASLRSTRSLPTAQDLNDLRRASDVFSPELAQIGANPAAMHQDLMAMAVRQDDRPKGPIDIRGEADLWAGAGQGRSASYGLNKDGRLLGTSNPVPGFDLSAPVDFEANFGKDMTYLHETAITLSGTNEKGPQWTGTLVETNLFGNPDAGTFAFGNQSDVLSPAFGVNVGYPVSAYRTGDQDFYLQNAGITFGGQRANVSVGRLGYSLSPYVYQRIDNTTYFHNDRWDNGLNYFDGAILGFDFGRAAKLDVFGGRDSGLSSARGVEVSPQRTGPYGGPFGSDVAATGTRLTIDSSVGANLKLAVGSATKVDLAYLWLNSNTDTLLVPGVSANRLNVYGADVKSKLGPIELQGGYHKSDLLQNSTAVNTTDNSAWNLRVGATRDRYSVFGEYRQIEANYLAPGDWGRLGVLRNPSNIKGFRVGGSFDVTRKLTVSATGEFDSGVSDNFAPTTFLSSSTGIDAFDVKVTYKVRHNLSVFGEFEDTRFTSLAAPDSYAGSGNPNYQWATFGLGYGLTSNAHLDLLYELSDVSNDYQVSSGSSFHGGFLTTQLTIKF